MNCIFRSKATTSAPRWTKSKACKNGAKMSRANKVVLDPGLAPESSQQMGLSSSLAYLHQASVPVLPACSPLSSPSSSPSPSPTPSPSSLSVLRECQRLHLVVEEEEEDEKDDGKIQRKTCSRGGRDPSRQRLLTPPSTAGRSPTRVHSHFLPHQPHQRRWSLCASPVTNSATSSSHPSHLNASDFRDGAVTIATTVCRSPTLQPSSPAPQFSRSRSPRELPKNVVGSSSYNNEDGKGEGNSDTYRHMPPQSSHNFARNGRACCSEHLRSVVSCQASDLCSPVGGLQQSSPSAANRRNSSFVVGSDLYQKRRLSQRFPGDMSHRPLDMLKTGVCAADPPRRHRKRVSDTDLIDALDTIGVPYHHGGPYDATLISRNLNEKYSPVAAVHDSNMEAIRATPRENVQDSLQRHVPLQGTASVAPGERDLSGQVMNYAEGADLMRETDAAGGAYKRWPDIPYHPDDLKGKGEPSYTIDRNWKAKNLHRGFDQDETIEMQPQGKHQSSPTVRQRSFSNAAEASSTATVYRAGIDDLKRSHTASKGLRGGLMRRIGSLRKAGSVTAE